MDIIMICLLQVVSRSLVEYGREEARISGPDEDGTYAHIEDHLLRMGLRGFTVEVWEIPRQYKCNINDSAQHWEVS